MLQVVDHQPSVGVVHMRDYDVAHSWIRCMMRCMVVLLVVVYGFSYKNDRQVFLQYMNGLIVALSTVASRHSF